MLHEIDELKSIQDAFDQRKNALLEGFIPFREQLIATLQRFTNEAIEKGLHGVTVCKVRKSTKDFLHATLQINDIDLVVVSNSEVYQAVPEDPWLAAKILIYHEGDKNNTPYLEVLFRESQDPPYIYFAQLFTKSGPRLFMGGRPVIGSSGKTAVEDILEHFYGVSFFWSQKPTLEHMLKSETEKQKMGFLPNL